MTYIWMVILGVMLFAMAIMTYSAISSGIYAIKTRTDDDVEDALIKELLEDFDVYDIDIDDEDINERDTIELPDFVFVNDDEFVKQVDAEHIEAFIVTASVCGWNRLRDLMFDSYFPGIGEITGHAGSRYFRFIFTNGRYKMIET